MRKTPEPWPATRQARLRLVRRAASCLASWVPGPLTHRGTDALAGTPRATLDPRALLAAGARKRLLARHLITTIPFHARATWNGVLCVMSRQGGMGDVLARNRGRRAGRVSANGLLGGS